MERLIIFICTFFLVIHIFACLWIMVSHMQEDDITWIHDGDFHSLTDWPMYTTSVYFVATTVTTVGYGDIGAVSTTERVFATVLMLIGVFCFSMLSSSVASIVSNADS